MGNNVDFRASTRAIKSKVTLADVLLSYGVTVSNRHILCPLPNHQETSPSFLTYNADSFDGSFWCFGCSTGSDIISFVSKMENCTPGQALAKLAKAFNIELVTKENTPDKLVENLKLILKKKTKEVPKEISELVHWQIIAERATKEFETMGQEIVPYLVHKKLPHVETKSKYDILIVPMKDVNEKIWSFQQIYADGVKMFVKDSKKRDLMLRLGPDVQDFVFICEGWATAASVFLSTGVTSYVAFSASNIDNVARQLKDKYPAIQITVAGDNDESGRIHHQKAIYTEKYKTDWSDVYMTEGPASVKNCLLPAGIGV